MTQDTLPALIVAHGQPSDPALAAAALDRLAGAVAKLCPSRNVAAATLAQEGALEAALARLGPQGVVFPMFMAGGWFTRTALTARLRAAGVAVGVADGWHVLEPFGCDGLVHDLACEIVASALTGQDLARAEVLIAAHGSGKSPAPSDVAFALARRLHHDLGLARVAVGFIDQTPRLADAVGFGAGTVCLPFFAAMGGHVTQDIPLALGEARFGGRVLPPLGLDARVPAVIAAALSRAAPVCAQTCRWSPITPAAEA